MSPTTMFDKLLLCHLIGCVAAYPTPDFLEVGSCATVKLQPNFEIHKYQGLWWEILSVPNKYVDSTACTIQNATLAGSSLKVYTTGLDTHENKVKQKSVLSPNMKHGILGDSADLVIEVPGVATAPYQVLATDYRNYSCIYSCVGNVGFKTEFAWVFGRTPHLGHKAVAKCNAVFKDFKIDSTILKKTKHGKICPYYHHLTDIIQSNEDYIDSIFEQNAGVKSTDSVPTSSIHSSPINNLIPTRVYPVTIRSNISTSMNAFTTYIPVTSVSQGTNVTLDNVTPTYTLPISTSQNVHGDTSTIVPSVPDKTITTTAPVVPSVPDKTTTTAPVVPDKTTTAVPVVPVVPNKTTTSASPVVPDKTTSASPVVPDKTPSASPVVPVVPDETTTASPVVPVVPDKTTSASPVVPVVPDKTTSAAPVVPDATTTQVVPDNTITPATTVPSVPDNTITPATTVPSVPDNTITPATTVPSVPDNTITPATTVPSVPDNTITPATTVPSVPDNTVTPATTVPSVPDNTIIPPTIVPPVPDTPTSTLVPLTTDTYPITSSQTTFTTVVPSPTDSSTESVIPTSTSITTEILPSTPTSQVSPTPITTLDPTKSTATQTPDHTIPTPQPYIGSASGVSLSWVILLLIMLIHGKYFI